MPSSYRVEISPNNRAGCQDKVCKDTAHKITKGELRLGVWVTVPGTDHASWKWRHWGCVSGKTMTNIQESLADGETYNMDLMDGFDELSDEMQVKVQRVVKQGHIDAEDFNGDPEFNVPGKAAIRGRAKKNKAADEDDEADGAGSSPAKPTPKKAAKRGRKKVDEEEDEEEEAQPMKKKAKPGRKSKKAVEEEEEADEPAPVPAPAKKARGRPSAKKEPSPEEEEEDKPATVKKSRGKKAVKKEPTPPEEEEEEEEEEKPAPTKKPRGKKAAKKEPTPDEEDVEEEPAPKAKGKAKGSRGGKAAAAVSKPGRRGRSKG
ncbi:hypothetical protein F5Y15DRAFT_391422 [Xylariaceae sp. FL0016]|nr:hypothetical protein F5Y15DRAFT_391422 [Xylariaceae sp. FL0016]